ncbi:MAG: dTDP-4-amino-4,6-dideoxygalactose transaminase [Bacteroidales bacterium]
MNIPFNKPYFTGDEAANLIAATSSGKISGNGEFTRKCHDFFERNYGFKKVLLTNSCTDALEMAAILINIEPGDEVIMPSYTFVSTANAFILRGAKIVFADTLPNIPNIDASQIEGLITDRTKAIVVVHYAGIACDMDQIAEITKKHNLFVIEDAAHSIDAFYRNKRLGSIGHLATFSFHETKNIISGEGGMLVINDEQFVKRAEIIWEKGTNRVAFFKGEVDKYGWKDIGSSYLPSDLSAAVLFAQIENHDKIQERRKRIWNYYYKLLTPLKNEGLILLPEIPDYASLNGHLFYVITQSISERDQLIAFLKKNGIQAVFHYLPLHSSDYYKNKHGGRKLKNTDRFAECLVRLPFFYELTENEQEYICKKIFIFSRDSTDKTFFSKSKI